MDKRKIAHIARDVRSVLDRAVRSFGGRDAHGHRQARHLGGLCGLASVFLFDRLTEEGFRPQLVMGDGHYFIECHGWLVDVTATQFGQPSVVVLDYQRVQRYIRDEVRAMFWWNARKLYPSVEDSGLQEYRTSIQRYVKAAGG